jgi:hypothetical protein
MSEGGMGPPSRIARLRSIIARAWRSALDG